MSTEAPRYTTDEVYDRDFSFHVEVLTGEVIEPCRFAPVYHHYWTVSRVRSILQGIKCFHCGESPEFREGFKPRYGMLGWRIIRTTKKAGRKRMITCDGCSNKAARMCAAILKVFSNLKENKERWLLQKLMSIEMCQRQLTEARKLLRQKSAGRG